jgi:hypothetical protein
LRVVAGEKAARHDRRRSPFLDHRPDCQEVVDFGIDLQGDIVLAGAGLDDAPERVLPAVDEEGGQRRPSAKVMVGGTGPSARATWNRGARANVSTSAPVAGRSELKMPMSISSRATHSAMWRLDPPRACSSTSGKRWVKAEMIGVASGMLIVPVQARRIEPA